MRARWTALFVVGVMLAMVCSAVAGASVSRAMVAGSSDRRGGSVALISGASSVDGPTIGVPPCRQNSPRTVLLIALVNSSGGVSRGQACAGIRPGELRRIAGNSYRQLFASEAIGFPVGGRLWLVVPDMRAYEAPASHKGGQPTLLERATQGCIPFLQLISLDVERSAIPFREPMERHASASWQWRSCAALHHSSSSVARWGWPA